MKYEIDGHRTDYINWFHSVLIKHDKLNDYNLKQCLFGEHLLTEYPDTKQIIIVESEKSAIILKAFLLTGIPRCSLADRNIIVMATGGSQDLSMDRFKCFENLGKEIFLIPDIGEGETIWKKNYEKIARNLNLDITFFPTQKFIGHTFFDIYKLEDGDDIADYLTHRRFDEIHVDNNRKYNNKK
jgi:hypothetical protein